MPPDDEPDLQPAFDDLRRRQREQAPPFGAMRERALRVAETRPSIARRWSALPMIRLATAAAGVAVLLGWWTMRTPEPVAPSSAEVASAQRVEQLLTTIEKELELTEVIASPDYATDILLTQN